MLLPHPHLNPGVFQPEETPVTLSSHLLVLQPDDQTPKGKVTGSLGQSWALAPRTVGVCETSGLLSKQSPMTNTVAFGKMNLYVTGLTMPRVVDHSVDEAKPVGRRWYMGVNGREVLACNWDPGNAQRESSLPDYTREDDRGG